MTVYQFSSVFGGQQISFDPSTDVLNFDQTFIAAASVRAVVEGSNLRLSVANGMGTGWNVVLLNTAPQQLSSSHVTFADGSSLLFGDNSPSQAADNNNLSLAGGSGNDYLAGFAGNDTFTVRLIPGDATLNVAVTVTPR